MKSTEELRTIAKEAGFSFAIGINKHKVTHAICVHGQIVLSDANSHACIWIGLVKDS